MVSKIIVRTVVKDTKDWYAAVHDISSACGENVGSNIALAALTGSDTAKIIAALNARTGVYCGAASYRLDEPWIKRINTGVVYPKSGVGSLLIEEIVRRHPQNPQWCNSKTEANKWCECLGMRPVGKASNGRETYVWDVKSIKKWMAGR